MKTRYLRGTWAKEYREAASEIGVDSDYYARMTGAIISHIHSQDFRDRLNKRHTHKVAGLLVKVVRSRPEHHVFINRYDSPETQAAKQKCLAEGPGQVSVMMLAFLNSVPNSIFVSPKVSGPFKAACNELPKAQRDDIEGFVVTKFDLSDGS